MGIGKGTYIGKKIVMPKAPVKMRKASTGADGGDEQNHLSQVVYACQDAKGMKSSQVGR